MSTKTTKLGAITKGDWKVAPHGPNGCPIVGAAGVMVAMLAHSVNHEDQRDAAEANADLIVDAGNTANRTGKLPSELEEENAKLRAALEVAILELDKCERACKRAYTIADHHSIRDLRVVPNQLKVRNLREVLASLTT